MDERSTIAWLHRRFGFGLSADELDGAVERGLDAEVDRLLDPDRHGVPTPPDAWDGLVFEDTNDAPGMRRQLVQAVDAWLERMRTTPRPLEERMTWMWHDHFATSIVGVKRVGLLVDQLRTIQRFGMASFPTLVRAMTVDPAMLLWLDGDESTGRNPNENYGRELLELFTVGIGNHTEDDVKGAARALTGWRVDRAKGTARFVRRRHDDDPQVLLGHQVHDVDSVVAAIAASPALPTFVASQVITRFLGATAASDDAVVKPVATRFADTGLEIRPMIAAIVEAGLSRMGRDRMPEAPVPWLVRAERTAGGRAPAGARLAGLRAAGQVPMVPPDVGGWPYGDVWLAAAPVVARASLARAVAASVGPAAAVRRAARDGDAGALARAIGRPEGFTAATSSAIRSLDAAGARMALALCAPEQVTV